MNFSSAASQPADDKLMTKAFLRAGESLLLTQKEMAEIIGRSEASMSRIARQQLQLQTPGKEGEIALLFLRVFRSLGALLGSRETEMQKWLNAPNKALGGAVPRQLIKSLSGLFLVVDYLDAMRAKI